MCRMATRIAGTVVDGENSFSRVTPLNSQLLFSSLWVAAAAVH